MLLGAYPSVYILMLTLMPYVTLSPSCPKFQLSHVNPTCTAKKMRISEGPGPPPPAETCPSTSNNNSQCLSHIVSSPSVACSDPGRFRFQHCREFSLQDTLSDTDNCQTRLASLVTIDAEVGILLCSFEEILRRYDCETPYSVAYNCSQCREAYRQWLCASVYHYYGDRREGQVKPCRSICYAVQQKCPFFLPGDTNYTKANQYAGEPSFVCLDPNIPMTSKQMENAMYGEKCCYDYCDFNPHQNLSSGFCIHNRTDCLTNKYKATSCHSAHNTDGYYYFSPPAPFTSGCSSSSLQCVSMSMFVLVISVPTLVKTTLHTLLSSLILLSVLKSILKSLLSCLLPSPSLLLSRLRLLLAFVINCLFVLLRIAARTVVMLAPPSVVIHLPLKCHLRVVKPNLYYYGILLNVSFNSIVRISHRLKRHFFSLFRCLPRNFNKFTFLLFTLSFYYNFHILKCLNFLKPSGLRTDSSHRTLTLSESTDTLKPTSLRNDSEDALNSETNVKSNLLNKHTLVVALIQLFLKVINFLLERAVIILLKLCYYLSFLFLNKIKLKKLYEKQFVINLLLYLINLSQHYCFLSSNFKYYYYDYYLLFNLIVSLLLLCRYYQLLLFTMNIFIIEYNYSFR
uniref:Transmembrane protein FAM155B n=2 Tax=Cacopsylla melanoneura TaxID=428564 RepID=A0A8D8V4X3_9HEMI